MATAKMGSIALFVAFVAITFVANVASADDNQLIKAVCFMNAGPPDTPVNGVIFLEQNCPGSAVKITGSISGLTPGLHGFHIHEKGDLTNKTNACLSTGGHYNPFARPHGAPDANCDARHAGDLGNIEANAKGTATIDITDPRNLIKLCGPVSVIGRAMVVHAKQDDLGTGGGESTVNGNSGTRVGCCVIGITSPVRVNCRSDADGGHCDEDTAAARSDDDSNKNQKEDYKIQYPA